jgi:hypothetical protein
MADTITTQTSDTQDVFSDIIATVLEGEDHTRTAQLTEQVCETGRVISDHIILKPRQVTLRVEQSNTDKKGTIRLYAHFEALWKARTPFTLGTTHANLTNMVITSLSAIHKAPFKWTLKFTVTLTQVNLANTKFSEIPEKKMANKAQAAESKSGLNGATTLMPANTAEFQRYLANYGITP